jgi:hypothetical protein
MKTNFKTAFCGVAILLCAGVGIGLTSSTNAAQGPALIEKPQIIGMTATPLYDDAGNLTSLNISAKFKILELQPDGRTQVPRIVNCETDLVRQEHQNIQIGNVMVPFSEIKADFVGLAEYLYRIHFPAPLPQNRRRALREPASP